LINLKAGEKLFELKQVKFKNILDIDYLCLDQPVSCLVGASGSGKSTLLRLLNKLETPDSGTVSYNGDNLQEVSAVEHRRRVTMLPQTPVIYADSVRENLAVGLKMQHRAIPSDEVLQAALDSMRLKLGLDEETGRLSGGEKQRLCLARVFLLDSPVYLLDEPSAALDPENQDLIMDHVINYVRKNNKQLIMVTHALQIAKKYADRLVRLESGRIEDDRIAEGKNYE
jgi:putative ABC transport system ATP-binding protein